MDCSGEERDTTMTRRFLAGMLVVALAALPGRAEAAFPAGSRIVRAELDGMVASITYSAAEEAELVAAVYTEDGKELLASGRRTIFAAEDATADLRLTGTRPEYALLRVFLLGREDHAPLCASCRTSAFSCPPEEIEATEPKDFEADRVLDMGTGGQAGGGAASRRGKCSRAKPPACPRRRGSTI